MKNFQLATANEHQTGANTNTSLSAVNALALAEGIPWKEAYELLLKQGKKYGLMITEQKCWKNMLTDAGYVRFSCRERLTSYSELNDNLLCYTVGDAVDWCKILPRDGFQKAPTTAPCRFVNQLDTG